MQTLVTFDAGLAVDSPALAAGPPEQNIRQACQMILSQADTNKDGVITEAEHLEAGVELRQEELARLPAF